jgi:hypothetical protein
MKRILLALVLMTLSVVGVIGCGGGSSSAKGPTPTTKTP